MKIIGFIFFFLFVLSLLAGIYQYLLYTVKREEAKGEPVPAKHVKYFACTVVCLGICATVLFTKSAFMAPNEQRVTTQKAEKPPASKEIPVEEELPTLDDDGWRKEGKHNEKKREQDQDDDQRDDPADEDEPNNDQPVDGLPRNPDDGQAVEPAPPSGVQPGYPGDKPDDGQTDPGDGSDDGKNDPPTQEGPNPDPNQSTTSPAGGGSSASS